MKRLLTATLLAISVCLSASACGGKQEPEFGITDQQGMRAATSTLETAFNAGDTARAEAAFAKVLSDFDRENGSAMYGLALIASKKGDSDEAKQYFDRAIRSDSAEPSMKVWSYIYMARIFDLECSRARAVEYYEQALKVGDNSRNAQAAAREGIQKPYGDACK